MLGKKYRNLQLYGHEVIKDSFWKINENSNDVNMDIDTLRAEVNNINESTYSKENVYTKEETDAKIEEVVGSAPEALDTLKELSDALGNDENFASTMTQELATKVDKVAGKGLSENDFTNDYKSKVDNNALQVQSINNNLPGQLNSKVDKVAGKALSSNDFTNNHKSLVERWSDNNGNYGTYYAGNTIRLNNAGTRHESDKLMELVATDGIHIDSDPHILFNSDIFVFKKTNGVAIELEANDFEKLLHPLLEQSDLDNYYNKTETDNLLNNKVEKVEGKGLSTNDLTNANKAVISVFEHKNQRPSFYGWGMPTIWMHTRDLELDQNNNGASFGVKFANQLNPQFPTGIHGRPNQLVFVADSIRFNRLDNYGSYIEVPRQNFNKLNQSLVQTSALNNYYNKTEVDDLIANNSGGGNGSVNLDNYYNKNETDNLLENKVTKVDGKGLSENDFTNGHKDKLSLLHIYPIPNSNDFFIMNKNGNPQDADSVIILGETLLGLANKTKIAISTPNIELNPNPQSPTPFTVPTTNFAKLNEDLVTTNTLNDYALLTDIPTVTNGVDGQSIEFIKVGSETEAQTQSASNPNAIYYWV